jgi:hypothetical protein
VFLRKSILPTILLFFNLIACLGQEIAAEKKVFAILNSTPSNFHFKIDKGTVQKASKTSLWGVRLSIVKSETEWNIEFSDQSKENAREFFKEICNLKGGRNNFTLFFIDFKGSKQELESLLFNSYNTDRRPYVFASAEREDFWQVIIPNKGGTEPVYYRNIRYTHLAKELNTDSTSEKMSADSIYGLYVPSSSVPGTDMKDKYGNEGIYLKYYHDYWIKYGVMPNYLEQNHFSPSFGAILSALYKSASIVGEIHFEEHESLPVNWVEKNTTTYKNYSFPIIDIDKTSFTPSLPGYKFMPSKAVYHSNQLKYRQDFTVYPHKITDDLISYYKFEDDIKDETGKNHGKRLIGAEFTDRDENNSSLHISRGDFVELSDVNKLYLKNHSFTMSTWVKIEHYHNNYQAIACSSERTFRRGLQIAIRDKKPYFGFWNLDMYGQSTIEEEQWYHLVYRYDITTHEMAIFVNGKLDQKSKDILSFIGDGQLFIGRSSDGHELNGWIDNLMIWKRALGEQEVASLYQDPELKIKASTPNYLLLLLFLLPLLVPIAYQLKRKKKTKAGSEEEICESELPKKQEKQITASNNQPSKYDLSIYLFGNFKVIDKNGEDITSAFTPKVKSLFIAILIHSVDDGIHAQQLSNILWPEHSSQSAMNNRRVNISRLKKIMQEIDELELEITDKMYKINFHGNVYFDYLSFREIFESDSDSKLFDYLQILERGIFLKNIEGIWADKMKAANANRFLDHLLETIEDDSIDATLRLKASNVVLINDAVNETSLHFKVRYLIEIGKMNLAKITYEQYCKEYLIYYGEEYSKSFADIRNS